MEGDRRREEEVRGAGEEVKSLNPSQTDGVLTMRYSGISYWYEFNELDAKTHPIPEAIIDEGPLRMELLNDGDSGTLRATGTDGVRHDCSLFQLRTCDVEPSINPANCGRRSGSVPLCDKPATDHCLYPGAYGLFARSNDHPL